MKIGGTMLSKCLCIHDGEEFYDLSSRGFVLNDKRDIKEVNLYDEKTGEKTEKKRKIFNFVGFATNQNDEILVSFPKHYNYDNIDYDIKLLFKCIMQHRQVRPELYIGSEDDDCFSSSYPFASFFNIYDYFERYGLFYKDFNFIKPNVGGCLSWKETISRSEKYMLNGNLVFYPLFYRKNRYFSDFVTECMIFVIEYTIEKFGVFLDINSTGMELPEYDFLGEREYVVSILAQLRQETFKDHEIELLDSLISFFNEIKVGGSFYFKHYTFSSIWEDMVKNYLCKFYKDVDLENNKIIFDKNNPSGLEFKKQNFYTNDEKNNQFISPDYYSTSKDIQLIFDAKYFNKVTGMNYKQIAYMFMLMDIKDVRGNKKFTRTYSSLLLPSEHRDTKIHFRLNPKYGDFKYFIITEEYLNIKEIMNCYITDK